MTSKKLGALLRSAPAATVVAEPPASTYPSSATDESPVSGGVRAEPEVPLQVLIPAGIRKQLAVKAAQEGQSLRALVLRALRGLGIEVTEEDIRGKRGRRSS
jgi:hypothetical protein